MRLRVLPLVIVAFSATVLFKAGDLWSGLGLEWPAGWGGSGAQSAVIDPGRPPRPELPRLAGDLAPAAGETPPTDDEADAEDEAAAETGPDPAALAELAAMVEGPVRDPFDLSDEEIELLEQLVARREALEERAREMDRRAALLEAAEGRIDDKITDLKALQAIIEGLLVKHDEQEEAQMRSLVKIYENMKPKDAARIFEELDMIVLLDVIGRMKERKSAPILAKMNPDKAKVVTLELAQRRELPIARD